MLFIFKSYYIIKMISLLGLTNISSKQLEQLSVIVSDKEVMKWVGTGELWSIDKIKKNIEYLKKSPNNFMAWVIVYNSVVVGYLALTRRFNEQDIRIFIGREYQGKGIATTALKVLIKHLMKTLSQTRKSSIHLVSYVKPENIASNKIHVKAGFKLEGTVSKYGLVLNKYSYIIKVKSIAKSIKKSKSKRKSNFFTL